MSTVKIKEKISRLSPSERDDIRIFIDNLDMEDQSGIDPELLKELDRRREGVVTGSISLHLAKEDLFQLEEGI